jgi:hypothetical protein
VTLPACMSFMALSIATSYMALGCLSFVEDIFGWWIVGSVRGEENFLLQSNFIFKTTRLPFGCPSPFGCPAPTCQSRCSRKTPPVFHSEGEYTYPPGHCYDEST